MRDLILLTSLLFAGALQAAPADAYRQFDFGLFHRCALTTAGAVECHGQDNLFGQFGDGKPNEGAAAVPIRVIAGGARRIATGAFFSCAVVGESLQCWGDIPTPVGNARQPTTVIARGVREIAAGGWHACAIVDDTVACWGANSAGQAGGDADKVLLPRRVVARGASAIAAGESHTCAIADGALLCWGRVQPGRGIPVPPIVREPQPIFAAGVSAVAAGANHTCAMVSGALWCWGDNTHGQIGIGIAVDHARQSANMPPANAAARFVDGKQTCFSSLAIEVDCWVERPLRVIRDGVRAVIAKDDQTCALIGTALHCWGANAQGQLGIDSQGADVLRPTVAIARGVGYAATSGARTCAIVESALQCSNGHGFDMRDNAFGISQVQARFGVWRGTLGEHAIMLCLLDPTRSDSSYYFERDGRGIPLISNPGVSEQWFEPAEQGPAATWTLSPAIGARLVGTWAGADGAPTLPIRLSQVTAIEPGGRCMDNGPLGMAFNQSRIDALPLVVEAVDAGTRRVSVLDGAISFIELLDDSQQAAAFNLAMRRRLDDQLRESYECAMAAFSEYRNALEIELRAGSWLVLRETYESACGGAHPNSGIAGYHTWNLATGERVEPWTWIADSKARCEGYDCGYRAPDGLNDVLIAHATRNKNGDECADAVNSNDSYLLHPGRTGLIFSTDFAHVIRACDEDIEVPYAELAPFLSAAGKQVAVSIARSANYERPE